MPSPLRSPHLNARQAREAWEGPVSSVSMPGAGTEGLGRWSVVGMALLLFIALLALLCSSIRAKLTRRAHGPDCLPEHGPHQGDQATGLVPAATRMDLGGCEKDAGHQ